MPTLWVPHAGQVYLDRLSLTETMHCVGWPPVPAHYNAPVFAASAVNVMAAQSVSIDKYPKGEQQVGERDNTYIYSILQSFDSDMSA